VVRPRKNILVASDDAALASTLRFLLVLNGYRVTLADGAIAAESAMLYTPFDLLLVLCPLQGAAELLKRSRAIFTPSLVVSYAEYSLPPDWLPDSAACRGQCSSAAILERVKMMVAHKHGPKPHAV
jgi:CheY-like chemotaxis protein